MDNFQFVIIMSLALGALFLGAGAMSELTKPKRESCIKAGYTWSATKYECVVNLPRK